MASLLRGIAVRTSRLFTTPTGLAGLGLTGGTLVYSFNSLADSKDFFYQKFITNKDPDAIVDFYSTEDFLQILGIFPFATHAILAGVVWDEKAEQTNTVWNMMRISFDITEKEVHCRASLRTSGLLVFDSHLPCSSAHPEARGVKPVAAGGDRRQGCRHVLQQARAVCPVHPIHKDPPVGPGASRSPSPFALALAFTLHPRRPHPHPHPSPSPSPSPFTLALTSS